MNYYPYNTLTNYTTKLHSEISLQGDWEVGLSEIIFPKNWLNIGEGQVVTVVMYAIKYPKGHEDYREDIYKSEREEMYQFDRMIQAHISKGYYRNVTSLVNEINKELNKELEYFISDTHALSQFRNRAMREGFVKFRYDENTNLVSIFTMEECAVTMTHDLVDMLGFSRDDFPDIENQEAMSNIMKAERLAVVDSKRHSMFVYSDVVECVPVGDTSAPLLRVIDIETSSSSSILHKSFDRPRYLPLRRLNFESLEIDIRDGLGRPIPFENGTVIVTLHFRKANSSYLLT